MKYNDLCIKLIIFAILLPFEVSAFDDIKTHPEMTAIAVKNSILVKDSYLSNNLGERFLENENTIVKGKQILKWLEKGSTDEDDPICRASNHFHNPLLNWYESYMTDDILTWKGRRIRGICDEEWPYSERASNVVWATGYTSPAPNGAKVYTVKQEMNWDDAREYFKLALTEPDKTVRENHFAKTFQSIGQVMHLLEDMAVPAHVRNDYIYKETH